MTTLSSPSPFPVPWRITTHHRGETEEHITMPFQTAFAAAASVRCSDGQQPHFSECSCEQMGNDDA